MPDGVLNVLKPPGMTSHDVVDVLRRLTGQRRIGHTGTLDPGAAGVLVLVVGRATRIAEFLTASDKNYRLEITFGIETDSGDAFGEIEHEADASALREGAVREMLPRFTGTLEQIPPLTSAIKVAGRPLYERARRGEAIDVAARTVEVFALTLLRFSPDARARALLDVACSKGTYVRALARDLGRALGVGGHASFVLRTRVGRFQLDDASTLEELAGAREGGTLEALMVSMDEALQDLPAVEVPESQRAAVLEGTALPLFKVPQWERLSEEQPIRLRDRRGLLALARIEGGRLRPFKVLRDRGSSGDA